jgi:LmbE family N-acetylglucosaminyl deacetylase
MFDNKKILIVAAHPDDELLGCGATIFKLIENNNDVHVIFLSEGVSARHDLNTPNSFQSEILDRENSARQFGNHAGFCICNFFRLPNLRMNTLNLLDIVKLVSDVIKKLNPDIVFTHFANDLNSDHQISFEATLTALRPFSNIKNTQLLTFETLSSTEWISSQRNKIFYPNLFIDVTGYIDNKLDSIKFYEFEMRKNPHPRSKEVITALAKIRGSQCGVNFAEAFELVRAIY